MFERHRVQLSACTASKKITPVHDGGAEMRAMAMAMAMVEADGSGSERRYTKREQMCASSKGGRNEVWWQTKGGVRS